MSRLLAASVLALAACSIESSRPPITAGDGLVVDPATQKVTLDLAKVPILPTDCAEGQVLTHTATGWACAAKADPLPACASGEAIVKDAGGWKCAKPLDVSTTPVVATCPAGQFVRRTASGWACAAPIEAGTALKQDGDTLSVALGEGAEEAARGNHSHDALYRRADAPVAWDDVNHPATMPPSAHQHEFADVLATTSTPWPGTSEFSRVTGITAATEWPGRTEFARLSGVNASTAWPGTANFSRVTGLDANSEWPGKADFSRLTGIGPTTAWAGTTEFARLNGVTATTTWPGRTEFSRLSGVTGTTAWAGTVPWARVTGAPDLSGFVPQRTTANADLYVRTTGDDAACNGLADADYSVGVAPACAVSTLQRAFNLVPQFVDHKIVIHLAAGSYATPTGAALLTHAYLNKAVAANGSVTITGPVATPPTAVLLGSTSDSGGAPSTQATALRIFNTSNVLIRNLKINNYAGAGLIVEGSTVDVANLHVEGTAGFDPIPATVASAIIVLSGGKLAISGAINLKDVVRGIFGNLNALVTGNGAVTMTNVWAEGVTLGGGSTYARSGPLTINGAGQGWGCAITIGTYSLFSQGDDPSVEGIDAFTVAARNTGICANDGAYIYIFGTLTTSGDGHQLYAGRGSRIFLAGGSATLTCTNNGTNVAAMGFVGDVGSTLELDATFSTNCVKAAVGVAANSFFYDRGGGGRTTTSTRRVRCETGSRVILGAFAPNALNELTASCSVL